MGELKSSYELALERLKKRGVEPAETALTEEQKRRIGEIRQEFEAKMAELDIMKRSAVKRAATKEELAKMEARFAGERASLRQEMEKRLEAARRPAPG